MKEKKKIYIFKLGSIKYMYSSDHKISRTYDNLCESRGFLFYRTKPQLSH